MAGVCIEAPCSGERLACIVRHTILNIMWKVNHYQSSGLYQNCAHKNSYNCSIHQYPNGHRKNTIKPSHQKYQKRKWRCLKLYFFSLFSVFSMIFSTVKAISKVGSNLILPNLVGLSGTLRHGYLVIKHYFRKRFPWITLRTNSFLVV